MLDRARRAAPQYVRQYAQPRLRKLQHVQQYVRQYVPRIHVPRIRELPRNTRSCAISAISAIPGVMSVNPTGAPLPTPLPPAYQYGAESESEKTAPRHLASCLELHGLVRLRQNQFPRKPKFSLGLSSEKNGESSQHIRHENRIGNQQVRALKGIWNSSDSISFALPKWPGRRQRTHLASNVTRNPTHIEDHFPSVPFTGFMFGPPDFGPPGIFRRFGRQIRPPRNRGKLWPHKNFRVSQCRRTRGPMSALRARQEGVEGNGSGGGNGRWRRTWGKKEQNDPPPPPPANPNLKFELLGDPWPGEWGGVFLRPMFGTPCPR